MKNEIETIREFAKNIPQGPWHCTSIKIKKYFKEFSLYYLLDENYKFLCDTSRNEYPQLKREINDDVTTEYRHTYDKSSRDLMLYLVKVSPTNLIKIFDWYESRIKELELTEEYRDN